MLKAIAVTIICSLAALAQHQDGPSNAPMPPPPKSEVRGHLKATAQADTLDNVGVPMNFEYSGSTGPNIQLYWNFGDMPLRVLGGAKQSHTFKRAGVFEVTVVAIDKSDKEGRQTTESFRVKINPSWEFPTDPDAK
jgi:hypothetical protein